MKRIFGAALVAMMIASSAALLAGGQGDEVFEPEPEKIKGANCKAIVAPIMAHNPTAAAIVASHICT